MKVWLVWEDDELLSIHRSRRGAETSAEALRGRLARSTGFHARWIFVEHRAVFDRPDGDRIRKGQTVWEALDETAAEWPLLEIQEAVRAGEPLPVTRFLAVPHNGQLALPEFQFGPDQESPPAFLEALAIFREAEWDDLSIYLWFTNPGGASNGRIPADLLTENAALLLDAVRSATAPW